MPFFHEDQLPVAEHSIYHLRNAVTHLDGLTLARTTKHTLGAKAHSEDELLEAIPETSRAMETEFHGGEGVDPECAEDELLDVAELSPPLFGALAVQHRSRLLSRHEELEAA